jgi:hypothetical protein
MPVNGPSGGPGGNSGDTDSDEGFLELGTRVVRVLLSFDDNNHHAVEGIQFTHLRNNGSLLDLPHHGGFGGSQTLFDLDRNEHIVKISGRYNKFVTSATVETDTARTISVGTGGGGDGEYTYEAPPGFEIVGFFGRSGTLVDAIGVVLRAR